MAIFTNIEYSIEQSFSIVLLYTTRYQLLNERLMIMIFLD